MKIFKIKPIGFVSSKYNGQFSSEEAKKLASKIIIYPDYAEGLYNIEKYSHLFIIFYLDRLKEDLGRPLKVHIKRNPNLPLVGIFASRAQNRPNPIGLTVVKLIKRTNNILIVTGLDAYNKTPVIDIKPYIPTADRPKNPIMISLNHIN
ncbi:MAG: tRNA (N6-threonylcarbamoyladenosine(37)-N6)-methyltransferase TrmO [Candidatus Odinarchaeia archaeon]